VTDLKTALQEKEGKARGEEGCASPGPGKRERKAKQEPELAAFPGGLGAGGKLKVEPGEGEGLPGLGEEGGLSPGRELLPPGPHYSLGKEEGLPQLPHHLPAMGLEPLQGHIGTDPAAACNSFSVDSIMTASRDGSPGDRGQLPDMASYGRAPAWSPASPSHYPASCLYPGQTSLEELSSMTAACLSGQGQMGGLYRGGPWYAMPGHPSPNSLLPPGEHAPFPQRSDYFEAAPKPPSPGPECEGPYRSPGYRTSYYGQECDKY
jgi:hypothetical protein